MRHLTAEERATVARIVEDAGAAEVVRLLGTLVANSVPDLDTATSLRSDLCKVANVLAGNRQIVRK